MADPAPLPPSGSLPPPERPRTREPGHRRRVALGRSALVVALAMVLVVALAIAVDAPDRYAIATALALLADALSLAAIVLAVPALVAGSSRGAAVAGLIVAVLGNPLVLTYGLGALA